MSHYLGVATCACGWTGPSDEARAHLLASGRTRSWDEVREERLSRMTPEERGSHERRVAKIVETWRREGLIPDEDETTPARTQTDARAGSEESTCLRCGSTGPARWCSWCEAPVLLAATDSEEPS